MFIGRVIDAIVEATKENHRRARLNFKAAVLHPADWIAMQIEIDQAALRGESWALGRLPWRGDAKAIYLPFGLVAYCHQGVAEGWIVMQDDRGIESTTMIQIERKEENGKPG